MAGNYTYSATAVDLDEVTTDDLIPAFHKPTSEPFHSEDDDKEYEQLLSDIQPKLNITAEAPRYQYRPLERDEIRVFELSPGTSPISIKGTLTHVKLQDLDFYEALSYSGVIPMSPVPFSSMRRSSGEQRST
jgi:hypothetical protein